MSNLEFHFNNESDYKILKEEIKRKKTVSYLGMNTVVRIVCEILVSILNDRRFSHDDKQKIVENVNSYFVSPEYKTFFTNQVSSEDLNIDKFSMGDFLGNTQTPNSKPRGKRLDFYAVYIGYAGAKGFLKRKTLYDCFLLDKLNKSDIKKILIDITLDDKEKLEIISLFSSTKPDDNTIDNLTSEKIGEIHEIVQQIGKDIKEEKHQNAEKIFLKDDPRYKILILPFKNYNTGNEDIGGIIADRLKDLNFDEELDLNIEFWLLEVDSNFHHEDARKWKEYHNADLIIFGDYLSHREITKDGDIKLKYIGSENLMHPEISIKETTQYQPVLLANLGNGDLQGNIDFLVRYFSAYFSIKKKNLDVALNKLLLLRTDNNSKYIDEQIAYIYFTKKDYKSAEKYLLNFLKFFPFPNSFYNLGQIYLKMEAYGKAIESFNNTLKIDKKYYQSIFYKGVCYAKLKNFTDAIKAFEELLKIVNPVEQAKVWVNIGSVYTEQGNYNKAINCLNNAIEIDKTDFKLWYNLGLAYQNQGEISKSIESFDNAIDINEHNFLIWENKGISHTLLKEYEKAINCFNKAIEINENSYTTWFDKGGVYVALKNYETAFNCYDKAIEINEKYALAWFTKGAISAQLEDYTSAINHYEEAIKCDENYYQAWCNLGLAYKATKKYSKAISCFDMALRIKDDDCLSWYNKAVTYEVLGSIDEAIQCFKKVTELNKNHNKAWLLLARLFNNQKRYMEAIKCYDEAIRIRPNDFQSWFNKGLCNNLTENYMKAITCFQNALNINPNYHRAWRSMEFAYESIDDIEEADKCSIMYALGVNPNDPLATFKLGVWMFWENKIDQAENIFRKAILLGETKLSIIWLAHVHLVKNEKDEAIKYYILGANKCDSKQKFKETALADYEHLEQYGINKEEYFALIDEIEKE